MRRVNRMSVPSMMGSLIERGFTIACGTVWWADRSSAAWIRGTMAANNQRHRSAGSLGRAPIRLEVAIVLPPSHFAPGPRGWHLTVHWHPDPGYSDGV